jgi:hypothetical protein
MIVIIFPLTQIKIIINKWEKLNIYLYNVYVNILTTGKTMANIKYNSEKRFKF